MDMSLAKIGNIHGGKQGFGGILNSVLDIMNFDAHGMVGVKMFSK